MQREDSPWDDSERRPSHADRRKALHAGGLTEGFSRILPPDQSPEIFRSLMQRLLGVASQQYANHGKCSMASPLRNTHPPTIGSHVGCVSKRRPMHLRISGPFARSVATHRTGLFRTDAKTPSIVDARGRKWSSHCRLPTRAVSTCRRRDRRRPRPSCLSPAFRRSGRRWSAAAWRRWHCSAARSGSP